MAFDWDLCGQIPRVSWRKDPRQGESAVWVSNMAKQIESIEIFPGENGGHRVVHNFKREMGKKGGAIPLGGT